MRKYTSNSSKTTCRKLSDYVTEISCLESLLIVPTRNQSLDDFMAEAIRLRNELNRIGNNFNQAVKKLHTLNANFGVQDLDNHL